MNDLNIQMQTIVPDEQKIVPTEQQKIIPDEQEVVPSELSFYFTDDILIKEQSVIDGIRAIGWKKAEGFDGVKAVYVDEDASYTDKLIQIYNYRNNPPEGFSPNELEDQVKNLFDTKRQYFEHDGTLVTVPDNEWRIWSATKRLVDPVSKVVPGWKGVSEEEREFAHSQELVDAKLSKEDQQKIFQATEGWFPEEGDTPFLLQVQNVLGNIYDFVPDISGASIWAWKKMTEEGADIKALEKKEITFDEYKAQEWEAAQKNLEKTRYWEDLRNRIPLLAPYKNLYKAVVFNATKDKFGEGIELTDEQMYLLMKEGPITYQVARIAGEAIPYVFAIEGILFKGFGLLRGSKAYDNALEYVSKNTHKHGSPYEALVKYMEQDAIKKTWINKPKGKRFMNNVVKRYDKTSKRMTLAEKESLENSIKTLDKQIVKAENANDVVKVRNLLKQRELLKTQASGLKIKWLNNYTTGVIRNEAYASSMGGVCYSISGNDGLALGCELAGAILEPNIHSSVLNLTNSAMFRVGGMINGLNYYTGLGDNLKIWSDKNLRAKFFTGDVEDLYIIDKKTGDKRALTNKEIGGLRQFAEIFEALPVKQRQKVLGRMEETQKYLDTLRKYLPEGEQENLTMTISEMTGLSVLGALDELTSINIKVTNIKASDLIQANQSINQSEALMKSIDNRIQSMLGSVGDNPSQELQTFANKIQQSLDDLRFDVDDKKDLMEEVLGIFSDSLYGGSIADNPANMSQNFLDSMKLLEDFSRNGASSRLRQIADEQIAQIDKKVLAHWESVAKDLNGISGNYIKGYTIQDYFASQYYDGLTILYDDGVKKAYDNLATKTEGVSIDVTDSYRAISDLIDRNRGDRISNLANKLPPGHFNNKMMAILEKGANDSLNKFLVQEVGAKGFLVGLFENAPNSTESMKQAIELIGTKKNFTKGNINTIFTALADTVSQTSRYKNIGSEAITKLDVYDYLVQAKLPINMELNVADAMSLRSSLSTLKSKAYLGSEKLQSLNYNNMVEAIEKSVSDSLKTTDQKDAFNNALNLATDYHKRFDNEDSLLFGWGEMEGPPLSVRDTSLQDGKVILSRKTLENQNMQKVKEDLGFDSKKDIPIYKHKKERGEFIPWKDLLNDPVFAEKWMRDVAEPLIGRPVKQGDKILPNQTHIIDMTDSIVAQRAQIFKKLLQQELGSYMSLSKTGQQLMDFKTQQDILKLARDGKVTIPTDIKVSYGVDRIFKLSDDFNLLDIQAVQQANFGFDIARTLNKTIQAYDQKITKAIKLELKQSRKILTKEFKVIKTNINKLKGQRIINQFGTNLADPQNFYKAVIQNNNIASYKAIEHALTEGPYKTMSKKEFKDIAKELYKQWWNNNSGIRTFKEVSYQIPSKVDETAGTIQKARQALVENEGKLTTMYETNLGKSLTELDANKDILFEIFGKEGVQETEKILQAMATKSGINLDDINLQNLPKTLSVESWISRIYAIQRGVISLRYTLTEAGLQKYRVNSHQLLLDLMSQPEAAIMIRKLITEGLQKSPYLDLRLRKFFQSRTVNAIVANEVLSEEGELNFNNQGSLVGTDSAAGKLIRYPFTPEKEIQQRF